jgi:hypothetical protein
VEAPSGQVTLVWTAPGDDGFSGEALRYDLRWSLAPIREANFLQATAVAGMPRPARPGSRQKFVVTRLIPEQTYYFALKTVDESGNWSGISNVARGVARGGQTASAPAPRLELATPYPNPARSGAAFEVTLPREGRVHLEVFDSSGRRVKTLAYGDYGPGTQSFRWDLTGPAGERLEDGLYWVRLATRDGVRSSRFAIAR